ncbi:MAG: YncE family protein [Actinomycetota bacterium]|nr:YncE family protein [Actinomycetota bacterium]
MRRRTASAFLAFVLLAAGCGGEQEPTGPEPLGAAEPGTSPELTATPAGRVEPLDRQPEGMVYDTQTGLLAVAVREPNRLLLVDGASGEVRTEVPLPGHARHLQLAGPGGPVLVPAEDSDVFVAVELPGGDVRETSVGEYPHDAAQTESGRILVADERGGTLSVLDGGEVVATFDDVTQPGGVATVGDVAAVVDVGAFTLSAYDVVAEQQLGVLPAGAGPTHLIADVRGNVVVADTRGDALLVVGLEPLAQLARYPLPGTPYGVAYDTAADVLWVTLTARNEVVGIDLSGAQPAEVARFPTVRQPNTVAVDPVGGRLWIASRTTGELQTIDP